MNPTLSNGLVLEVLKDLELAIRTARTKLEAPAAASAGSRGFDPDNLQHLDDIEPTLVGLGVGRDAPMRRVLFRKIRGMSFEDAKAFIATDVAEFRNRSRAPGRIGAR